MFKVSHILFLVLTFTAAAGRAEAFFAWDFTFPDNGAVYAPHDDVPLWVRVVNLSTDGETLGSGSGLDAALVDPVLPALLPDYLFLPPATPVSGQLTGTTMFPGDEFDITLGTYRPVQAAGASTGFYVNNFSVDAFIFADQAVYRANQPLEWRVAPPPAQPVVPEPSTVFLLAQGLALAALRSRINRRT